MYSNKENINILTSLLVGYGVEHVVVCPGSRNAPLVHNFNEHPSITCHPVTDERSAGFMALGLRHQLMKPVAVCVTSGSALLNVLPAAAEATYQEQGIIVISADRPQQWIGQLDGQTMPQPGVLGDFVGMSVSLPEPKDDEQRWYCRRLVCEAMLCNLTGCMPSVHINVPVSEPLFDFTVAELPEVHQIGFVDWKDNAQTAYLLELIAQAKCPMVVVGQMTRELPDDFCRMLRKKVVVLADQLAVGERTFVDQMLQRIEADNEEYLPDLVLYLGGNTVSKRLRHFLRKAVAAMHIVVTGDGRVADVSQHTDLIVKGQSWEVFADVNGMLPERKDLLPFVKRWNRLYDEVKAEYEQTTPTDMPMLAVRLLEDRMSVDSVVYYANSMAVRLGTACADHYIYCNRGLNGIEGSLSTAAGASLAAWETQEVVYCVIGDLSFFYDQNALWQQQLHGNLRILLLNNGGGAIFKSLKGLEKSPVRDSMIAGGHDVSAEGVCQQFCLTYRKVDEVDSLEDGIQWLTQAESERPVVLEVLTINN